MTRSEEQAITEMRGGEPQSYTMERTAANDSPQMHCASQPARDMLWALDGRKGD